MLSKFMKGIVGILSIALLGMKDELGWLLIHIRPLEGY